MATNNDSTVKMLTELRDAQIDMLTAAPAHMHPTEAAAVAGNYVRIAHLLEHVERGDIDDLDDTAASLLAYGDQLAAATRDRITELRERAAGELDNCR